MADKKRCKSPIHDGINLLHFQLSTPAGPLHCMPTSVGFSFLWLILEACYAL